MSEVNLNQPPYFDDYDPTKNYNKILFKPDVALQARELTQIQDILQDQIGKFGEWAFKNGDIVDGCPISDFPNLNFVRLSDYASNSSSNNITYDASTFANLLVQSTVSNLTARILVSNSGFYNLYPNTNILYIQYINTGNNGATTFGNNELLTVYVSNSSGNTPVVNVYTLANTTAGTITTGNAHGISVGAGVIFINDAFVRVQNPTFGIVNASGSYAGNNVVGFQLTENIITADQDSSLYDNALGYSNFNAPGADRLQYIPTLITLDPVTAANTTGFNPIATYNYGSLVTRADTSNVYSVVANAISQRIYDEAGNYVVNPFVVDTVTSLTGNSIISSIDSNTVLGRVGPGVGYSLGNRVEILKTSYINMRRGVDIQTLNEQQLTFNYGGYFVVDEACGLFLFSGGQQVSFFDSYQTAVTSRTYSSGSPAGNLIGKATVRDFTYLSGTPGSNTAQYLVHVYNVQMNSGYNTSAIKSIYYSGGGYLANFKAFADVNINGLINASQSKQLYSFGQNGIKNLRDASNNVNTEYVYKKESGLLTMSTSGLVTVTITSSAPGGTDILPYGVGTLPTNDYGDITLIAGANVDSTALLGTVAISSTNTTITGSGTSFLQDFIPGDLIKVSSTIRTVNSVINSTSMTVDSAFGSTLSGQTYYKSYLDGKIIPFGAASTGYPGGSVNVTNSTSMTITAFQNWSNSAVLQSSMNVEVLYNVLRTSTVPAKKVINKNRFVKINVSNNSAGPNGPWSLGYTDIHKVSAIYGSSSGYSTTGANITSLFDYDTGGRDTFYGPGYLYPTASFSSTQYPYLLVQLDYFSVNTTPGVGFFTVESYQIDDANTANTNAIQTKDIPLYVDSSGNKNWLRDYVDFRTPANSTAVDTGSVDMTNSAAVTAAIASATINPSANVNYIVSAYGLNSPAYGKNLQSDITFYLPRIDLITLTPQNTLKVIEGRSAQAPQPPIFPDNSMTLATINVPPYPSLSTDQVDNDQAINQNSKTLIRDTSTAISTNLVTNRRYTMADIGKLDSRISSLEYYAQLTLSQQKAASLTVTDANGFDRFKNGIFVDSFTSFLQSCVANPEYNIAIDQANGLARPKFVLNTFKVDFNNSISTNVQKTGRAITLPYTSNTFISQPYATEYMSAAPVQSHWNGNMLLMPSYNNNICQQNTASVSITICNAQPWEQFANTPFGSIWGSWNTSTSTQSSTATSGQASNTVIVTVRSGWCGWCGSLAGGGGIKTCISYTCYTYVCGVLQGCGTGPLCMVVGSKIGTVYGKF
jgi:Domain of unknown function (DUF4815)